MPICSNHPEVETELACGSCSRPMCQECLTSFEAEEGEDPVLLCAECLEKFRYAARKAAEAETRDVNWAGALLVGLLAGVAGALVWYGIVWLTGKEYAMVAVVVGAGVGAAVHWGAGSKRGLGLQAMAGLISLSSLLLGEYLILDYFVKQFLSRQGRSLGSSFIPLELFLEQLPKLGFWTWAFIAVGVIVAFLIPVRIRKGVEEQVEKD